MKKRVHKLIALGLSAVLLAVNASAIFADEGSVITEELDVNGNETDVLSDDPAADEISIMDDEAFIDPADYVDEDLEDVDIDYIEDLFEGEEEAVILEEEEEAVIPEGEEAEPCTEEEDIFDIIEFMDEADPEEALQISAIIDNAITQNRDRGLYASLNAVFKALADSEADLCENNLEEIKAMIFEALKDSFDNTDEELLGAVDAAANRAKENGLISVMTSGVKLGASSARSSWNEGSKYFKPIFDGAIDALVAANPELRAFSPLIKTFGGLIFNTGSGDRTDEVLDELKKVEDQISTAENNLKDHTYNVVSLADIGDKYNTAKNKAATIRTLIGNINGNDHLSSEERVQQIADLYKDSEFRSLMSAMNSATDCFYSEINDIFETNLFDAAYNRACEEVMFSSEALDRTMPYIIKQFAYYTAAYATMGEVYAAYEEVYGEGSLNASRLEMTERLCGTDLEGERVCKSVADLISEYFQRDRFVFVGMSNRTMIPVNKRLYVVNGNKMVKNCIKNADDYIDWSRTPDYMTNSLLSSDQLKDLAAYCAGKNITVFDFLFNALGFDFYSTVQDPCLVDIVVGSQNDPVWYHRGIYYVPSGTGITGTAYLATGKVINKSRSGDSCRLDYEGVNAVMVTSNTENVKVATGTLNANLGILRHTYYSDTAMFFRAR